MTTNNKLPQGFTNRPGTMDDVDSAVELFNICSMDIRGKEIFDAFDVRNEWVLPVFNQETDQQLVFNAAGQLVAYGEVWAVSEKPVHPWCWVRIHPEYQGLGIENFLMNWGERRASQVLDIVPPEARVSYRCGTESGYRPLADMYEAHGMNLIRHSFRMRIDMENPPPAPVWPEGLEVRPYNHPDDLYAVYLTDDDAFKDHFGYVEEDHEVAFPRFRHFLTNEKYFDPALWVIVYDGDEIAGISLCMKHSHEDKDVGYLDTLAVRRPWRKRGLGLALLHHSFNMYWQLGFRAVGLGVDAENLSGALRLYKRAGMHVQKQFDLYEKELRAGVELATVALGE